MKIHRILSGVTLALATAVIAGALCDFPWYPEYADEFSKYDFVTPEMAKKAAAGFDASAPTADPVLIRNLDGCPQGYMVVGYRGGDLADIDKWNELADILNNNKEIDAAVLADKVSYLYGDPEKVHKFREVDVSAFTWQVPVIGGSDSIPKVLWGYTAAYDEARKRVGNQPLVFTGIIGTHLHQFQVFKFRTENNKEILLYYSIEKKAVDFNRSEFKEIAARYMADQYEAIQNDPGRAEENRRRWEDISQR